MIVGIIAWALIYVLIVLTTYLMYNDLLSKGHIVNPGNFMVVFFMYMPVLNIVLMIVFLIGYIKEGCKDKPSLLEYMIHNKENRIK
jgi:tryptophan-rich sensory protein